MRKLVLLSVLLVACGKPERDESAANVTKDSALSADLQRASDTSAFTEAADVAMREIPPDSTLPMPPERPMTTSPSRQPTMRSGTSTTPAATVPAPAPAPASAPGRMAPTPPRPTPVPVAPPAVRPAADERTGAAGDYPTPSCASAAAADQRRCLLAYLARSDVELDRNYQARIARLRSEAGTAAGAPDPEGVQRLRTAQRAWLVYRDTECRNRNRGREGALWAPVRARCLAEFSAARAAELR